MQFGLNIKGVTSINVLFGIQEPRQLGFGVGTPIAKQHSVFGSMNDLHFGMRMLRKDAGFTAAAVLVLAL